MAAVNLTLQGDRVRTIADSLTNALQQCKNLQFTGLEYYVKCPRQKCKKQPSNKFSTKDSSNSSDTIVIVLISVTATVITVLMLENIMCAINFSRNLYKHQRLPCRLQKMQKHCLLKFLMWMNYIYMSLNYDVHIMQDIHLLYA